MGQATHSLNQANLVSARARPVDSLLGVKQTQWIPLSTHLGISYAMHAPIRIPVCRIREPAIGCL